MIIKYNRPNCHALASYDGKQIAVLRPGINEFPEAIWNEHMKPREGDGGAPDPELTRLVSEGAIEIITFKLKEGKKTITIGAGDEELEIKKLPEAEAIKIVKATFNRKMLERWIDEETRHKVKRAIDTQLKPLLPENQAAG